MPTINQKFRTKPVTTPEVTAIESLTGGETLPSSYIPAIDVNNVIDPTASIGNQGNPDSTGLFGKFTQATIDKLFAGLGFLRPKHLLGNTKTAGDKDLISGKLLLPEAGSPLANLDANGLYFGANIYQSTEVDTKLKTIPLRVGTWGRQPQLINGNTIDSIVSNPITRSDQVTQTGKITIGKNGLKGAGFEVIARVAFESKEDNIPVSVDAWIEMSQNSDYRNNTIIDQVSVKQYDTNSGLNYDYFYATLHAIVPATAGDYYFRTAMRVNTNNTLANTVYIRLLQSYITVKVVDAIENLNP